MPDEMVSKQRPACVGLARVRFQGGDPADLVAIDTCSIRGAIANGARAGRIAVSSDQQTTIH
jgi:hypothetical protein